MNMELINQWIINNYDAIITLTVIVMILGVLTWTILTSIATNKYTRFQKTYRTLKQWNEFWNGDSLFIKLDGYAKRAITQTQTIGQFVLDLSWNFYGFIGHITLGLFAMVSNVVLLAATRTIHTITERN